ncbi:hypothetical protein [Corynebacterium amycolatum]|uniref:hypothetical protein n=1 Tax=Corynebacterium amycolatum TaxID=43765 RepID=UPI0012B9D103|nr:hypothetical protein [Corynebacterium amycolatum]KAA9285633.1 hypothetical protein F6I11_10505 [Corynebacterium amycolatum]
MNSSSQKTLTSDSIGTASSCGNTVFNATVAQPNDFASPYEPPRKTSPTQPRLEGQIDVLADDTLVYRWYNLAD